MRCGTSLPFPHNLFSDHLIFLYSDELMNHLRPFAQEDKEVTEADIRAFFDAKMTSKAS